MRSAKVPSLWLWFFFFFVIEIFPESFLQKKKYFKLRELGVPIGNNCGQSLQLFYRCVPSSCFCSTPTTTRLRFRIGKGAETDTTDL